MRRRRPHGAVVHRKIRRAENGGKMVGQRRALEEGGRGGVPGDVFEFKSSVCGGCGCRVRLAAVRTTVQLRKQVKTENRIGCVYLGVKERRKPFYLLQNNPMFMPLFLKSI